MNVLPFTKQVIAIKALCDGNFIRATGRIVGAHRDTIMRLGRDVGEGYARLHDELFVGLKCNYLEVDEAWSFVMKKQRRVEPTDPAEFGTVLIWLDGDDRPCESRACHDRNRENPPSRPASALTCGSSSAHWGGR